MSSDKPAIIINAHKTSRLRGELVGCRRVRAADPGREEYIRSACGGLTAAAAAVRRAQKPAVAARVFEIPTGRPTHAAAAVGAIRYWKPKVMP